MTASFFQRVATGYNASGTPTGLTVDVATATAAGKSLLVGIFVPGTGTVTSVGPDSQGNTYALEKTGTAGLYVYRSNLTTGLGTSDTIPMACTVNATDKAIFAVVDAFTGLGTYDASAANTEGASATQSLAVTALADDQVIYGLYFVDETGSGSYSVAAPFTECGTPLSTYSAGVNYNACGLSAYDGSPSAGTITMTVTNPGAHSAAMAVLAYPASAPAAASSGLLMAGVP
jgi:hypothetical protein